MPQYQITSPDGRKFVVTAPEGATQAEVLAYAKANFDKFAPPKVSTMGGEISKGWENLKGSAATGIEALFSQRDANRAAEQGVARGAELEAKHGEGPSWKAVTDTYEQSGVLPAIGTAVKQIPRAIAGQVPQLGVMAAGAATGARLGSPLGPWGAGIGGALGAGATLFPQMFGANVERQAQEQTAQGQPVDVDRSSAFAAAAGQTALEAAGTAFTLGSRIVRGVLRLPAKAPLGTAAAEAALVAKAEQAIKWAATKGVARGAAAEIPVEIAQQVLERAQAGLSVTSEDAVREYGEAAYLAGVTGGALGGVGGVSERGGARAAIETKKQAEAAKQAELAQAEAVAQQEAAATQHSTAMSGLGTRSWEDLTKYQAQVEAMPPSPDRDELLTAIEQRRHELGKASAEAAVKDVAFAKQSAFGIENAPIQSRDAVMAEREALQAEHTALTEQLAEADALPKSPARAAIIKDLRERITAVTNGVTPPPAPEGVFTARAVASHALAMEVGSGAQNWLLSNVVGKTLPEVQQMVEANPKLVEGTSQRAEALRELLQPTTVPPFQEGATPNEESGVVSAPGDAGLDAGADRDGAELPSGLAEPEQGGAPVSAAGPAGVDPAGVGGVESDPAGPAGRAVAEQPALAPFNTQMPEKLGAVKVSMRRQREFEAAEAAKRQQQAEQIESGERAPREPGPAEQLPLFKRKQAPAPSRGELIRKGIGAPVEEAPVVPAKGASPKQGALFTPTGKPTKAAIVARQAEQKAKAAEKKAAAPKVPEPVVRKAADVKAAKAKEAAERKARKAQAEADAKAAQEAARAQAAEKQAAEAKRVKAAKEAAQKVAAKEAKAKKDAAAKQAEIAAREKAKKDAAAAAEQIRKAKEVADAAKKEAEVKERAAAKKAAAKKAADAKAEKEPATPTPDPEEAGRRTKVLREQAERLLTTRKLTEAEFGDVAELLAEGKLDAARERLAKVARTAQNAKLAAATEMVAARAAWRDMKSPTAPRWEDLSEAQVDQWTKAVAAGTASMDLANKLISEKAKVAKDPRDAAKERRDELELDPDTTKATVRAFANKLRKDGLIDEKAHAEVVRIQQDRDMGPEDMLDELRFLVEQPKAQQPTGVTGVALPPAVSDELRAGNLASALNELATEGSTPFAKKLAERLRMLLGKTDVEVTDGLKDPEGRAVLGLAWGDGSKIALDGIDGLTEETLLHESTHAATEHVLAMPEAKRTNLQNDAVRELTDLWEAAKKLNLAMSKDAQGSLSEFVAEVMSKERLQTAMAAQPWKSKTLWEGFKRILLRLLGIADPTTMLEAAIASVDSIFAPPHRNGTTYVRPQLNPATQSVLDQYDATVRPAVKQFSAAALMYPGGWSLNTAMDEDGWMTKTRTRLADKAATIDERFASQFNGGVKDSLGNINPMLLFRQAEDANKMLLEFFQKGSLIFDKGLNLFRVTTDPEVRAPAKVYDMVKQWGDKHGKSFDTAKTEAGRILEAVRLHGLRDSNRAGTTDFPLHMTDAQIDQLYSEYTSDPMLREMNALMDESRIAMVDNLVTAGRISKEVGDEWKSVVGYVPFDRVEDLAARFRPQKKLGRGLAQLGALPNLVGSEKRPVKNAFDNYISTMGWMVNQTIRSTATLRTLRALEKIQKAKYLGRSKLRADNQGNTVRAYIDGEEHFFEVPSAYDAVAFNDTQVPLQGFLKVMGQVSNVLRTAITAVPTFSIKQITEDVQRAILQSGVRDGRAVTQMALKNFWQLSKAELRGQVHPDVTRFGIYGLTGEYDWTNNNPAQSLLKDLGYEQRKLLGSTKFGTLLHRLEGVTRASDLAIRMAIYDQTMAETKDQALAISRAREIINFRRKGAGDKLGLLNVMVQTIPFFNAYIQGMDVLLRALTGKNAASGLERQRALKLFYSRAAMMGAVSLMYALAVGDDDEYDSMDREKRDSSFILGGGVRIPVATELGVMFKAPIERMVEYFRKQGTPDEMLATEAIGFYFSDAFHQMFGRTVPIPHAVRPVLEAVTNFSFRTMRPIEGIYQKGLEPSERTVATTSEFAKAVAQHTKDTVGVDVSPIMIDHVFNGYLGTTAAITVAVGDAVVNPDKTDRPLHKMVGLSAFTYDPVGTRHISEFYDLREKVVQTHNTFEDMKKSNPERAEAYAEKNKEKLAFYWAVNGALERLQSLRAAKSWLDTPDAAKEYDSATRLDMKEGVRAEEKEVAGIITQFKREAGL